MADNKNVIVTTKTAGGFLIEAQAGNHTAMIDQPQNMGGSDKGPTPLEYVGIALTSCLASIAIIVAKQNKIQLNNFEASFEGALNPEVYMGKETAERSGFQNITIKVKIDANLTQEQKEAFMKEVENRCPVTDNLRNTSTIQIVTEYKNISLF